MKCAWLVALIALMPVTASAKVYGVWGFGTRSCGAWAADKQDVELPWKHLIDIAWVEGFMSAMDHDSAAVNAGSEKTDSDGLSAWMDNYCAIHPLDSISTAAEQFSIELARKR